MSDTPTTDRYSRDALDALRERVNTFEVSSREQAAGMRQAIERLQDSHEELGAHVARHETKLDDHAASIRLLNSTAASTDERLGRIETLLQATPRRALVAAGAPGAIWLAIEFLNWLRASQ